MPDTVPGFFSRSGRREKVLNDMEEQGYISAQQKEEALADNVYERIAEIDHNRSTTSTPYTFIVGLIIHFRIYN